MDEDKRLPYFFLGLGIGLAVGLLFAPKSGHETRTLIRSKTTEGKDYLVRRGEELRESASEMVERGKSAMTKQKEHLAAAVDAGRQAYRDATGREGPKLAEENA